MPKLALTAGAYQTRSVIASAQRCLNLYPEPMSQAQGEPGQAAHYPTPGLRLLGTLPQGPVRAIRQCTTGAVYAVGGDGVYLVDPNAWTTTLLGNITPLRPYPVSMQDNGVSMVIVDGTANGWTIDLASNTFASITATASQTPVTGATTAPIVAGTARYTPFTPASSMSLTSATVTLGTGYSGNLVVAIFSDASGVPSAQVGELATVVNPQAGVNPIAFDPNGYPTLTGGQQYWIGFDSDTSAGSWSVAIGTSGMSSVTAYADFPASSPATTPAAAVVCSLTMASDPGGLFAGADRVDFLDTYFLFNSPGTPQFYSSLSLSTSFDPLALDFANKESFSDLLITLCVSRREIWLLGALTTEIWYDAGASSIGDYQFQEIPGVFVDHGCAAKYSVAEYDNSLFWLSQDRTGQAYVLQGAGYATKRVSTFPIEYAIGTYSTIDDAIGFMYTLEGHTCYVLTFPTADHTWVYDVTVGLWHEWAWIDGNGEEHRHRANCCYPCNGTVVVGDWQNGNLYALDPTVFDDNGTPIKRQRSFPHLLNNGARVFYREFLADIETGNSPIAAPTTLVSDQITWPPLIAQLIGPTGNLFALTAIDWQRNIAYFDDINGYSAWHIALATQTTAIAAAPTFDSSHQPAALAVDPLSGDLLEQRGGGNGVVTYKLNPTTFAILGSYGVSTSFPSYPGSLWVGQAIVCVVCNGVSYAFLKESALSSGMGAFRVDTMTAAGFYGNPGSGATDGRGSICAGLSGGTTATVLASWDSTTSPTATVPLYVVTITAGAETYNIASWPTPNPHIIGGVVGHIAAVSVDPTWSHLAVYSLGCDLADGNGIMWVQTNDSVANRYYIIKVRVTDAAVLWSVPVSTSVLVNLQNSRINGSLWVFDGNTSWQIDTIDGTVTTKPFHGTSTSQPGYSMTDNEQQLALYFGNYSTGTNSPVAVSGTANFSGGWGLMGGEVTTTTIIGGSDISNRIWLDWSDDRGHSFGNPVSQSFGARGQYIASLQWQRLGYARDRVFRLTWSEPLATALQGAWIDLDANAKT